MENTWQTATDLTGRTVLVTGVASGIARATARLFAGAGATVLGGDRNVEGGQATVDDIVAAGGKAHFFPLDLTDPATIDSFVDSVVARNDGPPDVIASVAGFDKVMPFVDNTPDLWDTIVKINYLGPVRMIHRLLPAMMARRSGRIVTVASDAGRVGSMGETVYAGSKGAIIAFTKSLARETARAGITCNCVAPGPTDTPLFHGGIENERLKEALIKAIPLRRLAQPEEIANTIVYLATDATAFVTGQVISVSGGLTMHG